MIPSASYILYIKLSYKFTIIDVTTWRLHYNLHLSCIFSTMYLNRVRWSSNSLSSRHRHINIQPTTKPITKQVLWSQSNKNIKILYFIQTYLAIYHTNTHKKNMGSCLVVQTTRQVQKGRDGVRLGGTTMVVLARECWRWRWSFTLHSDQP